MQMEQVGAPLPSSMSSAHTGREDAHVGEESGGREQGEVERSAEGHAKMTSAADNGNVGGSTLQLLLRR